MTYAEKILVGWVQTRAIVTAKKHGRLPSEFFRKACSDGSTFDPLSVAVEPVREALRMPF